MKKFCILLLLSMSVYACSDSVMIEKSSTDISSEMRTYQNHEEASDFIPEEDGKQDGLVEQFDPHWLMSDLFFIHAQSLDAEALQNFFESTPYGGRSWLADAEIDGIPASARIIQVAESLSINPILLLVRMQVEQSLISRTQKPSKRKIDFAFGCGCYDYQECFESHRGLDKQLICAGDTLNKLFQTSQSQESLWKAGKTRKTLDQILVTPVNHATAALYAYTPWVLRGQGGNWLVWNITKKFTRFLKEHNLLQSELSGDLDQCFYRSGRAFIGDPCGCDTDCNFWSGSHQGFCHPAGFCSLPCEGGCPDLLNKATTFCIQSDLIEDQGMCVSKAGKLNGHCADLPQTLDLTYPRYVGESSSSVKEAKVCAPHL